jgi:hypothetical protein
LQHKVPKAWRDIDDLLDGTVRYARTTAEVKNAQMLVNLAGREREEGTVVDQFAVREAKLAQRLAFGEKRGDGFVPDLPTLLQVDLEDIRAMLGESEDRAVLQLDTVVQLEL